MMLGDFPPSSCATRLTVSAAARATAMPARVEPVNDTMSMSGMRRERLADRRAVAVDHVVDAGRNARFVHDLAEEHARHRRDFARLQHHGAAGGERRADLAGDLVHRPVPRRDEAADADRLAGDQRVVDDLVELESPEHLENLRTGARGPAAAWASLANAERSAHLVGDRGCHLVVMLLVGGDDAFQQLAPAPCGCVRENDANARFAAATALSTSAFSPIAMRA